MTTEEQFWIKVGKTDTCWHMVTSVKDTLLLIVSVYGY